MYTLGYVPQEHEALVLSTVAEGKTVKASCYYFKELLVSSGVLAQYGLEPAVLEVVDVGLASYGYASALGSFLFV
jgi:hypothetical protein